jgi:hypothetical protein
MDYGIDKNFEEISGFAHKLATILAKIAEQGTGISPEPIYDISLAIEWWGDKKHPFISIEYPASCAKEVANIFESVREEIRADLMKEGYSAMAKEHCGLARRCDD